MGVINPHHIIIFYHMKKLYFALFLLTNSLCFSQLSENFDAATTLPTGWVAFTGTNGLGTGQSWKISDRRSFSAPNSAFVRWEAGGLNEDWLVTPLINLTGMTGSTLTFYGGQEFTDAYGTIYQVKVSTTSQTAHASFTNVATYAEADFTDIIVPDLTSQKTVDLSAYNGQQIYIAFVMTQNDADNWFIDNVNVTASLSTDDFSSNLKTTLYPNPTNGIVNIKASAEMKSIELYSILGNLVKTYSNEQQLDLSNLSSGTYIMKLTSVDGDISRQKLIKQ